MNSDPLRSDQRASRSSSLCTASRISPYARQREPGRGAGVVLHLRMGRALMGFSPPEVNSSSVVASAPPWNDGNFED